MAQRRPKSESTETQSYQCGLALAGIEAATIARKRVVDPESAKPPDKADTSTRSASSSKRPVPTPRSRSKSHSGSKPIPRVANSESAAGGRSSLPRLDCAPAHIRRSPQQGTVGASKGPPPPVAPKPGTPHRHLTQLPQDKNVDGDSRRSTLPQNWKPAGCHASFTTVKSEDESLHGGKRIHCSN